MAENNQGQVAAECAWVADPKQIPEQAKELVQPGRRPGGCRYWSCSAVTRRCRLCSRGAARE